MAEALPVEVLLGIYLGLLVGVIPALISWSLGFAFKYITNVTLPGFGVTILAIALAGVNGGLLAIADQSITQSPNAPRIVTAIVVVGMMSMYAHSKGDAMGAAFPHRLSLRGLRDRTLSLDLADVIPDRNEVRIRIVGEVADMEGYPPLSEELRGEIRGAEFTFPVDLRIAELEERLAERLQTAHDLGEAAVTIDERGRATVVAAPPFSGLSKRIGEGRHAVSVDALMPTGLARGDEVTAITADAQIRGTVVSARSGDGPTNGDQHADRDAGTDDDPASADEVGELPTPIRAPTTSGGEGRLTLAVTRTDVQPLLRADRAQVVVESRGTRREYEAVSLLRRADRRFRRLSIEPGTFLDGTTLGEARIRSTHDVAILAVRGPSGWQIAPRGDTALAAGMTVIAVGRRDALDAFAEVVA